MWNKYSGKILGGMACACLGLTAYEVHYILHPPLTFTSSPLEMNLTLTGLSSKLATGTGYMSSEDLSQPPTARFYLQPVLPIQRIQDYVRQFQADFLLVDFQEVDLRDDSLFQQIHSKLTTPLGKEGYRSESGEIEYKKVMETLRDTMRSRATIHMVNSETEVYEAQFVLAWVYQHWYGHKAYQEKLAHPRYPVVVLRHMEKCKNASEAESRKLREFYEGLMKWVGTAHIFIESSADTEHVLASLEAPATSSPLSNQT